MNSYTAQRIVGLGSLCIASAVFYFLLVNPSRDQLSDDLRENQNLAAMKGRLIVQLAKIETGQKQLGLTEENVWPGSDRAALEAGMQKQVTAIAERASVRLTAFGAVAGPSNIHAATIGYQIEGQAAWADALEFVDDLNQLRPPVSISEFWLRAAPTVNAGGQVPQLTLRAVIWGFAPDLVATQ